MDQHEIDTELAASGALLQETSVVHLAYTGPDGTPRVVPVGFHWTGAELIVSTAATAPKVAALRARPDVAVAVDTGGLHSLSLRGRASIEIVDGIVPEYLAAARRNMGAEAAAEFERNCRALYVDGMARIAIAPTWARFYDFGTGRTPRFLRELAERTGH
jgi:hypothetical protein